VRTIVAKSSVLLMPSLGLLDHQVPEFYGSLGT
jgi:hypothetical protein